MKRETAISLAGAGGLLAGVSLALPWFSVTVSGPLADQLPGGMPSLGHQSGWEALGGWHWVVLALAVVAGLRGALDLSPAVPAAAAGLLLAIVGWRFIDPPSITSAFPSSPTADPLGRAFESAFLETLTDQVGLGYTASVGMFFAAGGAAAALYATLNAGPARARA